MTIRKPKLQDVEAIVAVIDDSDLGTIYFKHDKQKIERMVRSEIEHDCIVIGEDHNQACVAVLSYKLEGAFGFHPYIHIITVATDSRGKGYGKQLLKYFEEVIVLDYRKILLLVGKWNSRAIKLYEKIGYKKFCEIDEFYTENVTEILMIKERDKKDA